MAIKYEVPTDWICYDVKEVLNELLEAKAAVLSLTNVPFQRSWAERLQRIQLKQEVAGTSRIEGAEFTERELDVAIANETPEDALTRSQKQARSAQNTYIWIAQLPDERPADSDLICEVHRRIITGCDDDHCEPGALRGDDHNVTFGTPRHRGAEGGKEVKTAFSELCRALGSEFRGHDVLVRGLALHYHLGAMHPFADGNGRTARAIEALLLQRAGLRNALFISLSNYYYDEKANYLKSLSACRAANHDITEFVKFGLKGITSQCKRLLSEINLEIRKALFRDLTSHLFNKLSSPRKRLIAKRQMGMLNILLDAGGPMTLSELRDKSGFLYTNLKDEWRGQLREIVYLLDLEAIDLIRDGKKPFKLAINLSWPEKVDESEFLETALALPSARTYKFLQREISSKKNQ